MGYIQTFLGLGGVVMASVISLHSIGGREIEFLFGSVFVMGGLYVLIGGLGLMVVTSVLPFLLLFALLGALFVLAGTSFQSILQKKVPNHMIGRVFGVVGSVGNGAIPLAVLIYGFLMSLFNHAHLLIASGLIFLPLAPACYMGYSREYKAFGARFFTRKPGK
jgi:hypothetical protein